MTRPLALVTGASGGIGSVVAQRLYQEGYSLILMGKTQAKLQAVHNRLAEKSQAGQCLSLLAMDMRQDHDWWRLRTSLEGYQGYGHQLSLIAVCHGADPMPCATLDAPEAMQKVFTIDVLGTLKMLQIAAPYMLKHHTGSIAIVSSLHARQTYPERVPYAVSKAALVGMARALAVEWGPQGVRTNVLLPWQVEGPRSSAMIEAAQEAGEDLEELYKQRSPLRRLVRPEDIADTILWLVRTESMNGAELVMDGGVSSSMWFKPFQEQVLC